MEINKLEVTALQQVTEKASDDVVMELSELQLALVGGGGGDVVFA